MKLTLIGSGIRTPLLLNGLVRRSASLAVKEVVLYDTDAERLDVMGRFAAHFARSRGAQFSVRHSSDFRDAAQGADFVFSAVRVGQEPNRIHDERVPLKYEVLGQETTGPGGFAMALRTIPVALEYARILESVAPDCWLVNFTNPAGIITQALNQHSRIKAVGICDTPTSMGKTVASFLGVSPDETYIDYFGLNHLGWIRHVYVNGQDRMPELVRRYAELRATSYEWRFFDPELIQLYGLLPNEYLYYYYYRERAVRNILKSGSTRGEQILGINRQLWRTLRELLEQDRWDEAVAAYERAMMQRSSSYMRRESGEVGDDERPDFALFEDEGYEVLAMAVMTAVANRQPSNLILNVPNRGSMPELDPSDVVEVGSFVDQHAASAIATGRMPEAVRPLVVSVKEYERLTVQAAVSGSYHAALRALIQHPLVGSYSLARCILDDYLAAHSEYLPQFEGR